MIKHSSVTGTHVEEGSNKVDTESRDHSRDQSTNRRAEDRRNNFTLRFTSQLLRDILNWRQ